MDYELWVSTDEKKFIKLTECEWFNQAYSGLVECVKDHASLGHVDVLKKAIIKSNYIRLRAYDISISESDGGFKWKVSPIADYNDNDIEFVEEDEDTVESKTLRIYLCQDDGHFVGVLNAYSYDDALDKLPKVLRKQFIYGNNIVKGEIRNFMDGTVHATFDVHELPNKNGFTYTMTLEETKMDENKKPELVDCMCFDDPETMKKKEETWNEIFLRCPKFADEIIAIYNDIKSDDMEILNAFIKEKFSEYYSEHKAAKE